MIAEYSVTLENKTKSELILFIKELQNILKEKDSEIERLEQTLARNIARNVTSSMKESAKSKEDLEMLNKGWEIETEKKDKIIDLMANSILTRDIGKNRCQFNETCTKFEKGRDIHCKDCIKQYFERKVKMEIEVEEYVRTKNGKIDKIINNNCYMPQYIECEKSLLYKEDIVNHSKNIIDLIEVGDYVNGKLIHKIDKGQNYCYLYYGNCKTFVDYQIKTILTKEQYQANCYTVERQ